MYLIQKLLVKAVAGVLYPGPKMASPIEVVNLFITSFVCAPTTVANEARGSDW